MCECKYGNNNLNFIMLFIYFFMGATTPIVVYIALPQQEALEHLQQLAKIYLPYFEFWQLGKRFGK